jgi:hypothetical protein
MCGAASIIIIIKGVDVDGYDEDRRTLGGTRGDDGADMEMDVGMAIGMDRGAIIVLADEARSEWCSSCNGCACGIKA